ncbi:MAG: cobalamin biosynthesis protein CobG [Arenibacterium sp.]
MNNAPQIKGWCPGALRPMMSADGLVLRVRPWRGQLSADQALGLCDLADAYGTGHLDLTNRANLQLRGIGEDDHGAVLNKLRDLGLLDPDPALEARRNVIVAPFWTAGDDTQRLHDKLVAHLGALPALPGKCGFAIDCGPAPVLQEAPADMRIERGRDGLILRADGAAQGQDVTEDDLIPKLVQMTTWLSARIGPAMRRMRKVLEHHRFPSDWTRLAPLAPAPRPPIGTTQRGHHIAAPFGQIDSHALRDILSRSGARGLRLTPWRSVLLENTEAPYHPAFVYAQNDPLLKVSACPGAPHCASSSVETRHFARGLAGRVDGILHVSGCQKGCAFSGKAAVTLVGREGRFDLVRQGRASDTPDKTGLTPKDILTGGL